MTACHKQSLTQTNHTRWCIYKIRSPDDEHLMLETCRQNKWINKYMEKCTRLVINRNLWRDARSTKHKIPHIKHILQQGSKNTFIPAHALQDPMRQRRPLDHMTHNTRTLIRRHQLYTLIRYNNLISNVTESSKAIHRNTKWGCS